MMLLPKPVTGHVLQNVQETNKKKPTDDMGYGFDSTPTHQVTTGAKPCRGLERLLLSSNPGYGSTGEQVQALISGPMSYYGQLELSLTRSGL